MSRTLRFELLAMLAACGHLSETPKPPPVDLGDGCFVVNRRAIQCHGDGTDCIDVTPCPGLCKQVVFDADNLQVPIERCQSRWREYVAAQRLPPSCDPVQLVSWIEPADSGRIEVPRTLALPVATSVFVLRSGKDKLSNARPK